MKQQIKQKIILVISSSLLASCATAERESRMPRDLTESGSDCISIRTIRDYTPLDRSRLLIEGGGKRLYYVTLVLSSFQLRSSHQIGVDSRDAWLCPYGGDRLVFSTFGDASAGIRGITRITPEQAEDLLYRYGKKERPELQDPVPPELDGAEVEELGEVG
ncbi:MAG: DUF6491 family protein [Woeseiaceae bacterium]|nr:DUF6491 family protein [Woeseiaceae bacterium]